MGLYEIVTLNMCRPFTTHRSTRWAGLLVTIVIFMSIFGVPGVTLLTGETYHHNHRFGAHLGTLPYSPKLGQECYEFQWPPMKSGGNSHSPTGTRITMVLILLAFDDFQNSSNNRNIKWHQSKTTLETPITKLQEFNFLSCQTKIMCFIVVVEYFTVFFSILGNSKNLRAEFQIFPKKHTQKGPQNRSKTQWLDKHRPLKAEPPGSFCGSKKLPTDLRFLLTGGI